MLLFPTGYKLWYIILPLFSLYCFSLIYMATLRLICGPWDFHSAEACRIFTWALWDLRASQVELVVKNPPANAETSEMWAQSVSGGSPGGGHGSPVQDSCLGRPTDRGAWRAPVHRVAQSQTRLRGFAHTVSLVVTGGIFNLPPVGPGPLTRGGTRAPCFESSGS